MSNISQLNSTKLGNITEKLVSQMLLSNTDQLPVQIESPKVDLQLTTYYIGHEGRICNFIKHTSRLPVMIDGTKIVPLV